MRKNNDTVKAIDEFPILKGKRFIPKLSRIFIEISGKCNAKCPYCARQHFKQRYAGKNMSPVLFEQILDHLINIGLLSIDQNSTIYLYNWGDPFLNSEINNILKILKKKKLYAGLSSNFIATPEINKDNFSVIKEVIFSLSGFSQESYGRIHGASLNKVLNNFEWFYKNISNYHLNTNIYVAWHRYRFNEKEFWAAYRYFDRTGIHFRPTVAVLNEYFEMLRYYTEGMISKERQTQAEKDLFLTHISKSLPYHIKGSICYHCFQWNYLVVDETGKLLLCCGMTNNDLDHVLGNVLEMSAEKIWEKKLTDPVCIRCISSGLARASIDFGNIPFPPGGRASYYKLLYQLNLLKVVGIIKGLPGGKKIVRTIKMSWTKLMGT